MGKRLSSSLIYALYFFQGHNGFAFGLSAQSFAVHVLLDSLYGSFAGENQLSAPFPLVFVLLLVLLAFSKWFSFIVLLLFDPF